MCVAAELAKGNKGTHELVQLVKTNHKDERQCNLKERLATWKILFYFHQSFSPITVTLDHPYRKIKVGCLYLIIF